MKKRLISLSGNQPQYVVDILSASNYHHRTGAVRKHRQANLKIIQVLLLILLLGNIYNQSIHKIFVYGAKLRNIFEFAKYFLKNLNKKV